MVGTGGHGHTFPGAVWPFGMVQVSPDTRIDNSWDGCSGYHYSDTLIYGFSHTHLSGTGVSDYGDMMLMPSADSWSLDPARYRTGFDHSRENASAGSYAVHLDNGIGVELVAGKRCGMHRYRFPKGSRRFVLLDLLHRDQLLEGWIQKVNDRCWKVFRRSAAWARDQHCYAFIEFSAPAKLVVDSASCKVVWDFGTAALSGDSSKEFLLVKVALSGVDDRGAAANLAGEMPDWDWEGAQERVQDAWDQALGVIEVTDRDSTRLRTFYTALYHCMIHPSLGSDADGRYRGRDGRIHKAEHFDYYTVFSLWDTYRALHPLLMLVDTVRTRHFVQSFLEQYKQAGRLPVWEFAANETNCMIGYHAVSVLADAAVKGLQGVDWNLALEAMVHSANQEYEGISWHRDHGHLSVEACSESVSKNLEYAYDDWCIAQTANVLGDSIGFRNYLARSASWRNVLDSASGLMRPRKNGQWLSPFDPREVNNHYTEANAWQTSFYVPQDVYGWIDAVGGPRRAEALMDTLFETGSATSGREQADITGLIGQYAHGNEPSHHIAYLYHYLGRPDKTLRYVRSIQDRFYSDRPDGLIGNEDCGQMSAWYVLTSMGLYALTPGSTEWMWSVPSLERVRVRLPHGTWLDLRTDTSCLVGTTLPSRYLEGVLQPPALGIEHSLLMKGGRWDFLPQEVPPGAAAYHATQVRSVSEGSGSRTAPYVLPKALPRSPHFGSLPLIESSSAVFGDSLLVRIRVQGTHHGIVVARGNDDVLRNGIPYRDPIVLHASDTLHAVALDEAGRPGFVASARFHRIDPGLGVQLKHPYNRQYHAGGPLALVDGVEGDLSWRKGDWHGYQGADFEAVITLPATQSIQWIEAGFLQDVRSWIVFPTKVEFWGRTGKDAPWMPLGQAVHEVPVEEDRVQRLAMKVNLPASLPCTELKIQAKQYGPLPAWHPGAGGESFIFVDEIRWK